MKNEPINKKAILIEECLNNANEFFEVACNIDNNWNLFKEMVSPYVTNLSLACELYLKYLLYPYVTYKKEIEIHKLDDLYKKLEEYSKQTCNRINEIYCSQYTNGKTHIQLSELLKEDGDNFKNFRYLYEHNKKKIIHFTDLERFAKAIRKVCIDK